MGEEIFTFLRESKYSVSLITVPFCPVAPCPFQILAGVLNSSLLPSGSRWFHRVFLGELSRTTVMILSFQIDMPGQTVVCHSICIIWTCYSMVEPHSSNFRVITTNFLGVQLFRKFMVVAFHFHDRCSVRIFIVN